MKRLGKSFTVNIPDVETTVDVDVHIYPSDLTLEMVKEWVDTEASDEDIAEVLEDKLFQNAGDATLEKLYSNGTISLFQIKEFIDNHSVALALHNALFPENK
jgi:hypothetical protein